MVAPEYAVLLDEYARQRAARATLLREAADAGVAPTRDEIREVQREWQQD